MRKNAIAMMMAMVAAAGLAIAVPATSAGAQQLSCSYTMSTTTLDAPGPVQVSGVAPGTTQVEVKVNGITVATVQSAPVTGAFGPVTINITATSTVTIALENNYGTIPCVAVGGEVVTVTRGNTVTSLPRTGSDTMQYVYLAVSVIGIGLVMVVGARRRRSVHSRV